MYNIMLLRGRRVVLAALRTQPVRVCLNVGLFRMSSWFKTNGANSKPNVSVPQGRSNGCDNFQLKLVKAQRWRIRHAQHGQFI